MRKRFFRRAATLCVSAPFALPTFLTLAIASPFCSPALADGDTPQHDADTAALPAVNVTGTPSFAEKNGLPGPSEGISARKIADTVNAMNTEDTLKYLPGLLVRKRYIGDTSAPMATRTTGINAGARSLLFADGVLLSTLINNNNGNGSPQWFMVSPQEIERVDVMYGPYSAAYAGNSYGAVTEITTRMPDRLEANVDVQGASQRAGAYGRSDSYSSQQYSANLGSRSGGLSWWVGANHLNSSSQPITFGTINSSATSADAALPVIHGVVADRSRTGAPIEILGAGNLVHTEQDSAKFKLAYDFSPTLTATYMLGYWENDARAGSRTYLSTASDAPYYGAGGGMVNLGGYAYSASAIAGQFTGNDVTQKHLMQSLGLRSHGDGPIDWEVIGSNFRYLTDLSSTSSGLYPAAQDGGPGRITDMHGTGWSTLDVKGTWKQGGAHVVSFGAHYDKYRLESPTYNTGNWLSDGKGTLFSNSLGSTDTRALWLQDAWRVAPNLLATLGGRYETWRAYDGYNYAVNAAGTGFPVNQPGVNRSGFSPKATLRWAASDLWSVTGSYGKALRFPTVGELYQNVQTGSTFTQANPFLKPESVKSAELAVARETDDSRVRLSLFQENVADALISQTSLIPGVASPVSFTQNVDRTRQRGIELVAQKSNALIRGLDLSGSLTYVDAKILANSNYVATSPGATSVGKRTPYVPAWRSTVVATYRPDDKLSYTVAGRYSSRLYATVDNTDVNAATYMGFEGFLVVDARVRYQFDKHWTASVGVDNLTNRNYFLYHPFPGRTVYAELNYRL